jgi:hypothetical protein
VTGIFVVPRLQPAKKTSVLLWLYFQKKTPLLKEVVELKRIGFNQEFQS